MTRGPRTTSIPRPSTGPPRRPGSRGDFTRPIPVDAQLVQRRRSRRGLAVLAMAVVAALGAALFVLPVRSWMNQRAESDARLREVEVLERANGSLQAEVDRLLTPQGIAEAARAELGYVNAGEERVAVVDGPALPTALPPGWGYDILVSIVAARQVQQPG